MKQNVVRTLPDSTERIIRVLTTRRGTPSELRVHYGVTHSENCDIVQLFTIEECH